jgi:hypothetical protein
MKTRFIISLLIFSANLLEAKETPHKSVSGQNARYLKVCRDAAYKSPSFKRFRSISDYAMLIENASGGELIKSFPNYIKNFALSKTVSLLPEFKRLDLYGNPFKHEIPGLGLFSNSTLRYIVVADQISRLFNLPKDYKCVEIGGGFGGQSYIISQLLPFSKYYIYDLPEVEMLITKMTNNLSIDNVVCLDKNEELPIDTIDLVISNYFLSECDRSTQISYLKRVISKAKRGYILFKDKNPFDHLSFGDLIEHLSAYGIRPTIHQEPTFCVGDSLRNFNAILITWDKTV